MTIEDLKRNLGVTTRSSARPRRYVETRGTAAGNYIGFYYGRFSRFQDGAWTTVSGTGLHHQFSLSGADPRTRRWPPRRGELRIRETFDRPAPIGAAPSSSTWSQGGAKLDPNKANAVHTGGPDPA